MHFLRKSLCSLITPSLYPLFQPPLLIHSITKPGSTFSKPLYMLVFSRSSAFSSTKFEAKRSADEAEWSKWMKFCAQNDQLPGLISDFKKTTEEERLENAKFLRDNTGSGLAMYLMHKVAPEDSPVAEDMNLNVHLCYLTPYPSQVLWDNTKEKFKEILAECEINRKFEGDKTTNFAKLSSEKKSVIRHAFAVGGIAEKETGNLDNDLLCLPATLETKVCFLFSPNVDENNNQQVFGHHSLEDNCTLDYDILDHVDCIGRGILKKRCHHESWLFILSQVRNQLPLLSGITTFEQVEVPASSDPPNGLHIRLNAFPVMGVNQIRRRFGNRHEDGSINHVSDLESCEYVEVVKLTGDFDVPFGQVTFGANIRDKLPPWSVLGKDLGAVWLTGFQKSGRADIELFILGEEYLKHGFADGYMYSAPGYYYMKCFKQMRPCIFCA